MGTTIGIGTYIGNQSSSQYWTQRSFRTTGRTGLVLNDEFGNNASILPSCGLCDENNYMLLDVANFGSTVSSGYVEWKGYYNGIGGYKWLFGSCDESSSLHLFNCYLGDGKPKIQVVSTGVGNVYAATNALSVGWHKVRFESVGGQYKITVDGNIVAGAMLSGTDNGKWINLVLNRDNLAIGCAKYSSLANSSLFYTDYIDFNGINKWYFSGQGIYEYDVVGGQNMSWTGTAHVYYGNNQSNQFLDIGYSLYTKEGAANEYIPYTSANTPYNFIASMQAIGYVFWGDIAGNTSFYNVAPALIEFPSAIADYDRSDETIHKVIARTGSDYDVAHPFRWRGSDVSNPEIYYSWKNTGYENKQFAKIDFTLSHPTKVYEFLSFKKNLSVSDKLKAETYCNIDDYYNVDIILMGDKTDSVDVTNNSIVNTVYAAQSPNVIIGVGDYDDLAHTTTELMAGITGVIKFSAPGNHDDWVTGVRTEFNANLRNGSGVAYHGAYKKISIPNIDFFLYDTFLKEDESGYYTYEQSNLISQATREGSTQGLWLIAQLAASTAKFKIVVMHQPVYCSETSNPEVMKMITSMRWDWAALGADLVIGGHFHFYERLLKATGSGNVPMIVIGTSGAGQIDWDDNEIEADSLYRTNSFRDTDFSAGHLVKMNVTRDKLQIDLSGIDTDGVVHSGKDQLIII